MKKSAVLVVVASLFAAPLLAQEQIYIYVSYKDASEEDGDGDGDGVKETHILRYRNVAGDGVFSMTTKDRLWAWSLESHSSGGEAAPDRSYVIRDSDCDGTFDERYSLEEQFHVPDCLK